MNDSKADNSSQNRYAPSTLQNERHLVSRPVEFRRAVHRQIERKIFLVKRVIQIISLLMICCVSVSCSAHSEALKPTDKLVIYCPDHLEDSVRIARGQFQKQFPEVEIEYKLFDNAELDYAQVLRTEVMAGKGPDVIFFGPYEFQDTEKAMDAGIFFDLNPLLEKDDTFDQSQYNINILNGGMYKGKRLYIPLSFDAISAVTTVETLQSFGIQLSETSSFTDWINEFIRWMDEHPHDTRALSYSNAEAPYFYCKFFNIRFMDLETGELLIDQADFRLFLDYLKQKFPRLAYDRPNDPRFSSNTLQLEALKNGQLLFYFGITYNDWSLDLYHSLSETLQARSLPLPAIGSAWSVATDRDMMAINHASPNKQNAYEFIKTMLSLEVQSQNMSYIPVNNEALSFQLRRTIGAYDLSDEDMEEMYMEIQNLRYQHPLSYTQYDLFEDAMRPWFLDEKSYEDCLDDFRNRLEIFIDE